MTSEPDVRLVRHLASVSLSLLSLSASVEDALVGPRNDYKVIDSATDDVDFHYSSPSKRQTQHRSRPRTASSSTAAAASSSSNRDRSESNASVGSASTFKVSREHVTLVDPFAPHRVTLSLPSSSANESNASSRQRSSTVTTLRPQTRTPFWLSESTPGLFPTFYLDTLDRDGHGNAQRLVLAVWKRDECVIEYDIDLAALVPTDQPRHSAITFATLNGEQLALPSPDADEPDESGYASDPGVASSSKSPHRPRLRPTKSRVLSISTRETRMTKPAPTDKLVQLLQTEKVVRETRDDLVKIRARVDALLNELALERETSERKDKLDDLRAVKDVSLEEITELRSELSERRRVLDRRKERLASARELHDRAISSTEADKSENDALQARLADIRTAARLARSIILTHLSFIYPIEPTPQPLVFSILSHALQNSSFESDSRPEVTATALGYVASLVTLLSSYLSIPLPYTILSYGSRSVVQDDISDIKGTRSFPLWEKGTEKWRMEYAVFLLNKDIEALVLESSVTTLVDLRTTLPNVKSLLLAFELSPNHLDYPPTLRQDREAVLTEQANGEEDDGLSTRAVSRTRASSNASTIRASAFLGGAGTPSHSDDPYDEDVGVSANTNGQRQGQGRENGHTTPETAVQQAEQAKLEPVANKKREGLSLWAGRQHAHSRKVS